MIRVLLPLLLVLVVWAILTGRLIPRRALDGLRETNRSVEQHGRGILAQGFYEAEHGRATPTNPYQHWDDLLAMNSHAAVLRDRVPASIRHEFTPAGRPCRFASNGEHRWDLVSEHSVESFAGPVRRDRVWQCFVCSAQTTSEALVNMRDQALARGLVTHQQIKAAELLAKEDHVL